MKFRVKLTEEDTWFMYMLSRIVKGHDKDRVNNNVLEFFVIVSFFHKKAKMFDLYRYRKCTVQMYVSEVMSFKSLLRSMDLAEQSVETQNARNNLLDKLNRINLSA